MRDVDLVTVEYAMAVHQVSAGELPLTFGRDPGCTIVFDPVDPGISRIAGSIENREGLWWVCNRSTKRSLDVVDERGLRTPVPPVTRRLLDLPYTCVILTGSVWSFSVTVTGTSSPPTGQVSQLPSIDPTPTESEAHTCTENERLALVALFAGYLHDHPRYDPRPVSYKEAGDRLGLPATTVRRRIEHLRQRLTEQGVSGLDGEDARTRLAEYALLHGLISKQDLVRLETR